MDQIFNAWFQVIGYDNFLGIISLYAVFELVYSLLLEPFDVF